MYHKNRIQFDSNQISKEDHSSIFSVAEVPVNSIVTITRCYSLSFSEKNVPFLGAQSCFRCTCKTTLHTEASYVTLREEALSIGVRSTEVNKNTAAAGLYNQTLLSLHSTLRIHPPCQYVRNAQGITYTSNKSVSIAWND
ncbi:hypothetical protein L0O88_03870 [Bacteroides nordii]|uniref:hypothetical protein n=1 Tax=Bacteroides nordii TaxID=291645 RepID=UPI001EDD2050|nr:hypothetical protein [Bacteroides nordii]MCG4768223.1 hypothetical protein [Bacteroides nordii]